MKYSQILKELQTNTNKSVVSMRVCDCLTKFIEDGLVLQTSTLNNKIFLRITKPVTKGLGETYKEALIDLLMKYLASNPET
jgi:hypothetical protein